jgi:hypothetical protein
MIESNQIERLRRHSRELGHYIHKLNKKGRSDTAFKIAKRQTFLNTAIQQIESQAQ